MIDIEDAIQNGISRVRAEYLAECEQACDAHYEYETSHQDAADSYNVCFQHLGRDIKAIRFDYYPVDEPEDQTIYLGQSEVEIQLTEPLSQEEADYFFMNTNYVVNSDLAYRTCPDALLVVAEFYDPE